VPFSAGSRHFGLFDPEDEGTVTCETSGIIHPMAKCCIQIKLLQFHVLNAPSGHVIAGCVYAVWTLGFGTLNRCGCSQNDAPWIQLSIPF